MSVLNLKPFSCFFSLFSLIFILLNVFSSCQPSNETEDITVVSIPDSLELIPCPPLDSSIQYNNVVLQNYTYTKNKMMFRPMNMRLGGMTPITETRPKTLPKTRKGNHLHICIDNEQHHISNNNIFDFPLSDGKYKLIAFISRSFYESIKSPAAIMAKEIGIRNGELYLSKNLSTVDIVYNAPTGNYLKGSQILLDFVLVGTNLEKGGNQVKVTINNQKSFYITKWQAYFINGLDVGTYEIKLELLDAEGKQIAAPTSRNFSIEVSEDIN